MDAKPTTQVALEDKPEISYVEDGRSSAVLDGEEELVAMEAKMPLTGVRILALATTEGQADALLVCHLFIYLQWPGGLPVRSVWGPWLSSGLELTVSAQATTLA